MYAFESSRLALLENGIGYYAVTSSLEDIISLWSWCVTVSGIEKK